MKYNDLLFDHKIELQSLLNQNKDVNRDKIKKDLDKIEKFLNECELLEDALTDTTGSGEIRSILQNGGGIHFSLLGINVEHQQNEEDAKPRIKLVGTVTKKEIFNEEFSKASQALNSVNDYLTEEFVDMLPQTR